MMKLRFFCFLFLLAHTVFNSFGQYSFSNFPQNLQFYERGSTGYGTINISGNVESETYDSLKLVINQNKKPYFRETKDLSNSGEIKWDTKILSGLFEYDFEILAYHDNDSFKLKSAERIICGDTYLIYGQSNAKSSCCFFDLRAEVDHTFIRNFVFDHFDSTSSNNGWHNLDVEFDWPGVIGVSLATLIIENYGFPVQIINGAIGGESLKNLAERDPIVPDNPDTFYGRFLKRIKGSNIKNIKGLIFNQGEWESNTGDSTIGNSYSMEFDRFKSNLSIDVPNLQNFYLIQTNIPNDFFSKSSAAIIRNEQRKTKDRFPDFKMYSGFGRELSGDGLHYSRKGYDSLAKDVFWGISHFIYGNVDSLSITGPLIKKAINFKGEKRIKLVFDNNQNLRIKEEVDRGSHQRFLKDYIYDGLGETFIDSFFINRNEVTLFYSREFKGNQITYLPSVFKDDFSHTYDGPLIKNEKGLAALSFLDYEACEALKKPELDTFLLKDNQVAIILKNDETCNDCQYEISGYTKDNKHRKFPNLKYPNDSLLMDLAWSGNTRDVLFNIKVVSPACESSEAKIELDKCPEALFLKRIQFAVKDLKEAYTKFKEGNQINKIILNPGNNYLPSPKELADRSSQFLAPIGRCVNN